MALDFGASCLLTCGAARLQVIDELAVARLVILVVVWGAGNCVKRLAYFFDHIAATQVCSKFMLAVFVFDCYCVFSAGVGEHST